MMNVKKRISWLSGYVDIIFLLKFFVLFTVLYYFNIFYVGLIDPKGSVYSSFLDSHLDYITGLRNSILYTSNAIVHAFGVVSYISDYRTLKVAGGPSVYIAYTCLGYGVMSFWAAFIIAQSAGWKMKLMWSIGGIFAIWIVNCFRVALLLVAYANKWQVNKYINHHDMFNIIVYMLIIFMVYRYYKLSSAGRVNTMNIVGKKLQTLPLTSGGTKQ